jgi:hypothetical protein
MTKRKDRPHRKSKKRKPKRRGLRVDPKHGISYQIVDMGEYPALDQGAIY